MKVILGLGNPGEGCAQNRHNLGFRVLDLVAARSGVAFRRDGALQKMCWTASLPTAVGDVVLAKPRTYMNRSGRAALALLAAIQADLRDFLVVHDDADLALGALRLRPGGGSGGHNGVRSLVAALGTQEFPRLRLGVRGAGREGADLAEYVLMDFETEERAVVADLIERGAGAVEAFVARGLEGAMNLFNGPQTGTPA